MAAWAIRLPTLIFSRSGALSDWLGKPQGMCLDRIFAVRSRAIEKVWHEGANAAARIRPRRAS
eukprot:1780949-Pyramimonas_sp.AAC.1